MAWRLQEIWNDYSKLVQKTLTDEEIIAVFLSVRDHTKKPFDDNNPLFMLISKSRILGARYMRATRSDLYRRR